MNRTVIRTLSGVALCLVSTVTLAAPALARPEPFPNDPAAGPAPVEPVAAAASGVPLLAVAIVLALGVALVALVTVATVARRRGRSARPPVTAIASSAWSR